MPELDKKQSPHGCRYVFRDYDGWLSCIKGKNYRREKCVGGKGRCDTKKQIINLVDKWIEET